MPECTTFLKAGIPGRVALAGVLGSHGTGLPQVEATLAPWSLPLHLLVVDGATAVYWHLSPTTVKHHSAGWWQVATSKQKQQCLRSTWTKLSSILGYFHIIKEPLNWLILISHAYIIHVYLDLFIHMYSDKYIQHLHATDITILRWRFPISKMVSQIHQIAMDLPDRVSNVMWSAVLSLWIIYNRYPGNRTDDRFTFACLFYIAGVRNFRNFLISNRFPGDTGGYTPFKTVRKPRSVHMKLRKRNGSPARSMATGWPDS